MFAIHDAGMGADITVTCPLAVATVSWALGRCGRCAMLKRIRPISSASQHSTRAYKEIYEKEKGATTYARRKSIRTLYPLDNKNSVAQCTQLPRVKASLCMHALRYSRIRDAFDPYSTLSMYKGAEHSRLISHANDV